VLKTKEHIEKKEEHMAELLVSRDTLVWDYKKRIEAMYKSLVMDCDEMKR